MKETKKMPPVRVAVIGNPNVGKSTVFNALTGMHQHTGNWAGKTVDTAKGHYTWKNREYTLIDLPGTYSLLAHSEEEACASAFIRSLEYDIALVICDAICLERNLNLVLQVMEITGNTVVCVNLMDEAEKKGIHLDLKELEKRLGVPVIGICAHHKKDFPKLQDVLAKSAIEKGKKPLKISYAKTVEDIILGVEPNIEGVKSLKLPSRYIALQLLHNADEFLKEGKENQIPAFELSVLQTEANKIASKIKENGQSVSKIKDAIAEGLVQQSAQMMRGIVTTVKAKRITLDRKLDKIFTGKKTGIPIMILLLLLVFWITIVGANYPSGALQNLFTILEEKLLVFCNSVGVSPVLRDMLVLGMFRVLGWVIAVMLPPMAIFFPLFTLLEDFGYLPRVAFNLDHSFRKANTCGKQALTMCMGFGCNAVGVTGCRIIDSPRERLIAILTNNFVPCNGRFPTLIAILSMFCIGSTFGFTQSFWATILLTGVIIFSVFITFTVSRILSKTLLKGVPSSFTLEMPPYRRPQFGKVIVRSIVDRTLFVLGRAIVVAAPAGILIYILANTYVGDASILSWISGALDPIARVFGLDGIILMAFILGLPANEIVVPLMIMGYLSEGALLEFESLVELKALLVANGWNIGTAICVMLFCLMHWPCSTTLLTIKKETGSIKWTALSFLIPTLSGLLCCFVFHMLYTLFTFIF